MREEMGEWTDMDGMKLLIVRPDVPLRGRDAVRQHFIQGLGKLSDAAVPPGNGIIMIFGSQTTH